MSTVQTNYGKAYRSKEIFDRLLVSGSEEYAAHLNKYNTITLSMNDLPGNGNTYEDYINQFKSSLIRDIMESYPDLNAEADISLPKLLSATVGISYDTATKQHACRIETL